MAITITIILSNDNNTNNLVFRPRRKRRGDASAGGLLAIFVNSWLDEKLSSQAPAGEFRGPGIPYLSDQLLRKTCGDLWRPSFFQALDAGVCRGISRARILTLFCAGFALDSSSPHYSAILVGISPSKLQSPQISSNSSHNFHKNSADKYQTPGSRKFPTQAPAFGPYAVAPFLGGASYVMDIRGNHLSNTSLFNTDLSSTNLSDTDLSNTNLSNITCLTPRV